MRNYKVFKRLLKRIYREFLAYKSYFFDKDIKTQKKVIIFAQGRSGSTLLESLLGSTKQLKNRGELLIRTTPILPYSFYIDGLAKRQKSNIVFHCKIYHLKNALENPNISIKFLNALVSKNWKIIYLKREQVARQVLSNFVANHRNNYQKTDDNLEDYKLFIDLDTFQKSVRHRLNILKTEQEVLKNIPHIEVTYEKDLLDAKKHPSTIKKILDYLDLENISIPTSKFKKVNTRDLSELIINYDEFMKCIKDNNWNIYLN